MTDYLGWPIIAMPGTPSAPQSIEITNVTAAAMNASPFSGQQQVQAWGATVTQWIEVKVSFPAMQYDVGQEWVGFINALQGVLNVFQFTSAFMAGYPNDIPSGTYFRLKASSVKYSIMENQLYGFSFEARQAM
jgi:hypothetical protein